MPLHATSKFENVVASVASYVRDRLDENGGGERPVRYPGDAFDASQLTAWFDLDVSPGPSRFHRQAAEGYLGATDTAVVRIDAKVRRDATAETYLRWRMADEALAALPVGGQIALADYASGPPYAALGAMKVFRTERSDAGERDGILVARVEARLRYARLFAP